MSKQNLNIQVLRAVAALLVVAGHASYETETIAALTGGSALSLSFFNWAAGVDIFFVISGFIMIYSSAELFNRPGGWRVFLIRRLTRIVPLYWFLTTLLLLGALIAPSLLNVPVGDWQNILASYLFIPVMRADGGIRPVLSLGWTLNLEMLFYAIFTVAVLMPYRYGVSFLALVVTGLAVFGQVAQPQQTQLAFWTQGCVIDFLFGSLLAAVYLKGVRLPAAAAAMLAALGIAGLFSFSWLDQTLPALLRWSVPSLLLVAAAAFAADWKPRALAWMVALGNASYSLYLVHPFVLRPMRIIWLNVAGSALPPALFVPIAMAAASIVALILYRLIEKPSLRFLHRLLLPTREAASRTEVPARALP